MIAISNARVSSRGGAAVSASPSGASPPHRALERVAVAVHRLVVDAPEPVVQVTDLLAVIEITDLAPLVLGEQPLGGVPPGLQDSAFLNLPTDSMKSAILGSSTLMTAFSHSLSWS
jgi:hypothetical protein